MASNGAGEGTTVLEAVVVAGRIARLLEDAELVRWASRDCAEGLALLQQVAGHGKKPLGASVSARR
ncbi:hypothetical protein FIV34_11670 [Luteibacter pinisoli]|uniref:Uncharacterized protein n=1 Tax=Luteibacter pinisoli TaxID=2589080 RepID=A0A4Y5Z5I0_9GAMM|nr:hypothetical protein [Luteibacter pinisoli]QDE39819.1 hypothetical protein FIV34_11670 [Luteibacter pinisoli]